MAIPSNRFRGRVSIKSLRGVFARRSFAKNAVPPGQIITQRCGWFDLTFLPLVLPRLAGEFHRYRIAQISDIHMDGRMKRDSLAQVVAAVNAEKPDLVAITGDFVSHDPAAYTNDLVMSLAELRARDGVLAVLGNHDHWNDPEKVREIIRGSGLQELRNQVVTYQRGQAELHVAGIDSHMARAGQLGVILSHLPEKGAALLLAHEPDFADHTAAVDRFDLQLSGHSHGGQVNLPLVGPPFVPFYAHKYPRGLYRVKKLWLYTNRGLGVIHLPWRYNSRPEIAIFELLSMGEKGTEA